MKIRKITNGFIDKELPVHHSGSFGQLDKGRMAIFEVKSDGKSIKVEFFISFLDTMANNQSKIDENNLFQKAETLVKEHAEEQGFYNNGKLLFLYNFSTNDFYPLFDDRIT